MLPFTSEVQIEARWPPAMIPYEEFVLSGPLGHGSGRRCGLDAESAQVAPVTGTIALRGPVPMKGRQAVNPGVT